MTAFSTRITVFFYLEQAAFAATKTATGMSFLSIGWVIKGKRFVLKKIETQADGTIKVLKKITIYDVFGFYQSSFAKVVESLVSLDLATQEVVESMKRARRGATNPPSPTRRS